MIDLSFTALWKKKCVSDKDHLDAANVCNIFEMETMGDYHNLYLKKDVLLLVDVFEKFTGACLVYYWSDTCHNFSSPEISWMQCLRLMI